MDEFSVIFFAPGFGSIFHLNKPRNFARFHGSMNLSNLYRNNFIYMTKTDTSEIFFSSDYLQTKIILLNWTKKLFNFTPHFDYRGPRIWRTEVPDVSGNKFFFRQKIKMWKVVRTISFAFIVLQEKFYINSLHFALYIVDR